MWLAALDPGFERFVADRSPALLRTAYLLTGDQQHGEDLLQTALLRTARRWRAARAHPEAYVRRTMANLAKDRHRGLRRRPVESFGDLPEVAAGPADTAGERDALLRALRALPARQRVTVVLRFWEDLSVDDTAALLGCSAGTVKSTSSRALARLRVLLDESARS